VCYAPRMSNHAIASHPDSLAAKLDRLAAEVAAMRGLLESALQAAPAREVAHS